MASLEAIQKAILNLTDQIAKRISQAESINTLLDERQVLINQLIQLDNIHQLLPEVYQFLQTLDDHDQKLRSYLHTKAEEVKEQLLNVSKVKKILDYAKV